MKSTYENPPPFAKKVVGLDSGLATIRFFIISQVLNFKLPVVPIGGI